ncbi:MAG: peptidyl-prolyl cis-trans isomerase [Gammaproteobacteria bacterium]|nr:MAG: peptidyl-prolyl cis-trans isomerase [Gammaproteobacteria bacterium]
MLKRLLREPLLHFLVLGGLLFGLYGLENDGAASVGEKPIIVVSRGSVEHLISLWERQSGRLPTPQELQGLIGNRVREEVLYREAIAMGLDRDDSVLRRRLAQKLEFITSDISAQAEPTQSQLQEWLDDHPQDFRLPARIDFEQVYLNADRRGEQVRQQAQELLETLEGKGAEALPGAGGDRFMAGFRFKDATSVDVAQLFGDAFAQALFRLPEGSWQGPLESGYGLHLVRIGRKTPARQPELEVVRGRVVAAWREAQRRQLNAAFYRGLRQRYRVVVETGETDT